MLEKDINFIPHSTSSEHLNYPLPATKFVPEWYKKMDLFMYKQKSYGLIENVPNTTMKACSPFLDGLTLGYIFSLPVDLQIKKTLDINQEYQFDFMWRTKGTFITDHAKEQHPNLPSPQNGMSNVYKWSFDYIIKTPKGYSTFFTHPINRHDLPFRTFSGVVETDEYTQAVQFPFQMLNFDGDQIIIERGTPVCQIFPFKRDNWKSKMIVYSEKKLRKDAFDFHSKIVRSYKNKFWKSKNFK